jgi:hypothetical protein
MNLANTALKNSQTQRGMHDVASMSGNGFVYIVADMLLVASVHKAPP